MNFPLFQSYRPPTVTKHVPKPVAGPPSSSTPPPSSSTLLNRSIQPAASGPPRSPAPGVGPPSRNLFSRIVASVASYLGFRRRPLEQTSGSEPHSKVTERAVPPFEAAVQSAERKQGQARNSELEVLLHQLHSEQSSAETPELRAQWTVRADRLLDAFDADHVSAHTFAEWADLLPLASPQVQKAAFVALSRRAGMQDFQGEGTLTEPRRSILVPLIHRLDPGAQRLAATNVRADLVTAFHRQLVASPTLPEERVRAWQQTAAPLFEEVMWHAAAANSGSARNRELDVIRFALLMEYSSTWRRGRYEPPELTVQRTAWADKLLNAIDFESIDAGSFKSWADLLPLASPNVQAKAFAKLHLRAGQKDIEGGGILTEPRRSILVPLIPRLDPRAQAVIHAAADPEASATPSDQRPRSADR